jgi:hypothetical protein
MPKALRRASKADIELENTVETPSNELPTNDD